MIRACALRYFLLSAHNKMADFRRNSSKYCNEEIDSEGEKENELSSRDMIESTISSDADPSLDENSSLGLDCDENTEPNEEEVLAPAKKKQREDNVVRPSASSTPSPVDRGSDSEEETLQKKKKPNTKKRSGPKSPWSSDMIDDLVDVVANNERYQRKLIFTNSPTSSNAEVYQQIIKEMDKRCKDRGEKFELSVTQTRNKFKKLMSTCKHVLLTIKTASGIKRFQDEKQYGAWFNCLVQLMKTRASCQPGQAIEPSTHSGIDVDKEGSVDDEADMDTAIMDDFSGDEQSLTAAVQSKSKAKQLFIPIKEHKKRQSKDKQNASANQFNEILGNVKTILDNDQNSTQQMLQFFEKENERARKHELELFSIMFQSSPGSGLSHNNNATYNQMGAQGFNSGMTYNGQRQPQGNFSSFPDPSAYHMNNPVPIRNSGQSYFNMMPNDNQTVQQQSVMDSQSRTFTQLN